MNVLSRNFTKRELFLMTVLFLLLLVLLYYRFVHMQVSDGLFSAIGERANLETTLEAAKAKLSEMQAMQKEIEENKAGGMSISYMPSYNYSKEEIEILNRILMDASSFSVRFEDVSRNGNQIRRKFTLNYESVDYLSAMKVLESLENCGVRCMVGDVVSSGGEGKVSTGTSVTFYETMYGGVEDSELPEEESQ